MAIKEPRFLGSYKGRIIKAISVEGARTWEDIQEYTGFHPKTLNQILKELFANDAITKAGTNEYRVAKDLYYEYKEYFDGKTEGDTKILSLKVKAEVQKDIVREFQDWLTLKKIQIEDKHVFLEGSKLESLSSHLVENSKSEILIVNPYIDKGNIVNELKHIAIKGVTTKILTRNPSEKEKIELLKALKEDKVEIVTNPTVHAKIMLIDRGVAIISSMNLYAFSGGGGSWEAGIATNSESIVEEIINTFTNKVDDRESKKF